MARGGRPAAAAMARHVTNGFLRGGGGFGSKKCKIGGGAIRDFFFRVPGRVFAR